MKSHHVFLMSSAIALFGCAPAPLVPLSSEPIVSTPQYREDFSVDNTSKEIDQKPQKTSSKKQKEQSSQNKNLSELDRASIIGASLKLKSLANIDAIEGRALPPPPPAPPAYWRLVELDAMQAGMEVTFVFLCISANGYTDCTPRGRK